jgi:deoxyribodipyrimidine photo-lyase
LGADFFHKHLLDGDPASNTLSWRWVAGLHTLGKSYLARRSNLEKYLAPELLDPLAAGLPAFENPQPFPTGFAGKPPITRPEPVSTDFQSAAATGLWIHEEDLSPETSPLALLPFSAIIVTGQSSAWERHSFPPQKIRWLRDALADAATRASLHWKSEVATDLQDDLATSLVHWARSCGFGQIITLRPEVGPLGDLLPGISSALGTHGIHLALIDRPSDLELRPLATGGFFQFWENLQKRILGKHQPGR